MEEYLLNGSSIHHRYFFAGGSYEVQVDASATTTKEYYSIGGMMVAMNTKEVIGENETNTLTYMASDHLTSASIVLDDTGVLLSEQRYMPFGEVRLDVGDTITETDLGYTGQRGYSDFGLMDYHARFYSPRLGRFVQPDSLIPGLGNSQAWDRYQYVSNSPINRIDPTGHISCKDLGTEDCDEDSGDFVSGDFTATMNQEDLDTQKKWRPGNPKTPKSAWDFENESVDWDLVADDPAALIAVILLGEQGSRILDLLKNEDARGVVWSIVLRHFRSGRYNNWRESATSMVNSNDSPIAVDPLNNWGFNGYFSSKEDMLSAYNQGYKWAQEAIEAVSVGDFSNSPIPPNSYNWRDGYCTNGCIDADNDGTMDDTAFYERTHFGEYQTGKSWCVYGAVCDDPIR